uniref:Speedy/RINGO cell cycle regulator family member C n=1 Tax=Ursus maritimus TaxID=29073 RepID=A0A452TRX9_URSMA
VGAGGNPTPPSLFSTPEHSFLQEFLSKDPCFQISDKYLLAMVLVYFRRASLRLREYTHSNLFLALFLANDMEEDVEDPKCVIFLWALGKDWHLQVADFLHQRDKLWARMGFRAMVSRECCEEVRPHHHTGGVQGPPPGPPSLSPQHCSLCGWPPSHSHCPHQPHPLPVLSKCPSPNPEWHCPPLQACLSVAEDPLVGGFLIIPPPQLQLEPGTYSLHILPKPPPCPGH